MRLTASRLIQKIKIFKNNETFFILSRSAADSSKCLNRDSYQKLKKVIRSIKSDKRIIFPVNFSEFDVKGKKKFPGKVVVGLLI
jgi:hypothetical protein